MEVSVSIVYYRPGVNFFNMFTPSFYSRRCRKRKKLLDLTVFFAILGAARKMLVKSTPAVVLPEGSSLWWCKNKLWKKHLPSTHQRKVPTDWGILRRLPNWKCFRKSQRNFDAEKQRRRIRTLKRCPEVLPDWWSTFCELCQINDAATFWRRLSAVKNKLHCKK